MIERKEELRDCMCTMIREGRGNDLVSSDEPLEVSPNGGCETWGKGVIEKSIFFQNMMGQLMGQGGGGLNNIFQVGIV